MSTCLTLNIAALFLFLFTSYCSFNPHPFVTPVAGITSLLVFIVCFISFLLAISWIFVLLPQPYLHYPPVARPNLASLDQPWPFNLLRPNP